LRFTGDNPLIITVAIRQALREQFAFIQESRMITGWPPTSAPS